MLRYDEIQEKLLHLVGWKQNYDTSELKINGDLTESESGLFFQQAHPLLTLENLASIAPDFKNADFPEFDSAKAYKKGDLAKYGGKLYKAVENLEPYAYEGRVPAPAKQNLYKNGNFKVIDSDVTVEDIRSGANVPVGIAQAPYKQNTIVRTENGHGIAVRNNTDGSHRFIGAPVKPWDHPMIANDTAGGRFTFEITTRGLPYEGGYFDPDGLSLWFGYVFVDKNGKPLVFDSESKNPAAQNSSNGNGIYNYVLQVDAYDYSEANLGGPVTHRLVLHIDELKKIIENGSTHISTRNLDDIYVAPLLKPEKGADIGFIIEGMGIYAGDWSYQNSGHLDLWQEVDLFQECFSEWLKDKTKASIQKAISAFCNKKLSMGTQKALLENRTLFDGAGRLSDTIENKGRIVGFEIVPVRSRGVHIRINRIGLQAFYAVFQQTPDSTRVPKLTLYLSHSSSRYPLAKVVFAPDPSGSMKWLTTNIDLTVKGDTIELDYAGMDFEGGTDSGGSYYLWYVQNSYLLAVNKDKDWSKAPCSSCSRNEAAAYAAWSKYIEVHPFYAVDTGRSDGDMIVLRNRKWPAPILPEGEPAIYLAAYLRDVLGRMSEYVRARSYFRSFPSAEDIRIFVTSLNKKYAFDTVAASDINSVFLGSFGDDFGPFLAPFSRGALRVDSFLHVLSGVQAFTTASSSPYRKYDETYRFNSAADDRLWDISKNVYTYDHNYGLNLDITVECDLTDFIVEQKNLFVDIIMKQVAVDMLREFAYNANVRTNRHSLNASRSDILYEIDGDSSSMKQSGLAYQLEQAIAAADMSLRGIDRVCLPCKNNGVKYRSV